MNCASTSSLDMHTVHTAQLGNGSLTKGFCHFLLISTNIPQVSSGPCVWKSRLCPQKFPRKVMNCYGPLSFFQELLIIVQDSSRTCQQSHSLNCLLFLIPEQHSLCSRRPYLFFPFHAVVFCLSWLLPSHHCTANLMLSSLLTPFKHHVSENYNLISFESGLRQ